MLMSPNKGETVVYGSHCPGDVAVRMRKVLAIIAELCSVTIAFRWFIFKLCLRQRVTRPPELYPGRANFAYISL